jgi:hypothetical protein
MTANDQQPRGPFVGCFAAAILLAPIAYVLSVGPATWLHDRGYLPDSAGMIYMPLAAIADVCKPIDQFFEWYLAFWQ